MKIIRFLSSNLASLLIAFSLAVLIWVVATQESDPVRAEFLSIPIKLVGQPEESLLTQPQSAQSVQIWFEGVASAVTEMRRSDFTAVADLSDVPFGTETSVPVQVQATDPRISIISSSPEQLTVYLEEQVTRDIEVTLDLRGQVALGHKMGDPLIDPPFITATGSASRVNALETARVTVFLNNEKETVSRTAVPIYYDHQGEVASVSSLDMSANQVEVTIPVEESAGFAEKFIVVDEVGALTPGYRLLNVVADPASVLLQGSPSALRGIASVQTEPVDITGLTESTRQQVALVLPTGVALAEPTEIFVDITIEPFMTTATYNREIQLLGVGDGLTAVAAPENVRVVLFGPLPVLDTLLDEEVVVSVDLFGLEAGVYSAEPDVAFPDRGIELRSIQPANITVEITRSLPISPDGGITGTLPITATEELTATGALPVIDGVGADGVTAVVYTVSPKFARAAIAPKRET